MAKQHREDDHYMQWLNGMRSVKIRLARMPAGSRGRVVYEMSEILSENPFAVGWFRACLEGKVTGLLEGIPDTLVTDSLAAALSGDGRGERQKRQAGGRGPPFLTPP